MKKRDVKNHFLKGDGEKKMNEGRNRIEYRQV